MAASTARRARSDLARAVDVVAACVLLGVFAALNSPVLTAVGTALVISTTYRLAHRRGRESAYRDASPHLDAIQHGKPDARPTNPAYEFIGPYGVNGFAPHSHEGRRHSHDGGADPHAHPMFEGDDRDPKVRGDG